MLEIDHAITLDLTYTNTKWHKYEELRFYFRLYANILYASPILADGSRSPHEFPLNFGLVSLNLQSRLLLVISELRMKS